MSTNTDERLKTILARTRTIALVGFSNKPDRASHKVARYLAENGYRVIPVNPGLAGQSFMGEEIVADLGQIPGDAQVDMLDVFRRSDMVMPIVESALENLPGLKTVWLQIGVTSAEAQGMAEAKGLDFVEDRCPKIEHARLLG
ncbi:CoA-binding protein [Sinisalibacter lacisalsi]|uniref:CoA-binding protein n=1 Tax=Sinisalibacter lacisalsi TaxID=1526570 RepID=A0ABQ1QSM4_9RHOB|nr:CoA-binding protein [Sinisalibacter lacisalsi]GGD40058.1 CoA-binding protein [Sinisalibacter lacisalsi]